jgi:integral membrane sensor domain MASE1
MSQLLGRIGLAPDSQVWRLPQIARNVLLVSAGYYAGGVVGILLGFPPSGIAAIWPSTAILLAALLLTPPRHWWIYICSPQFPRTCILSPIFSVPKCRSW